MGENKVPVLISLEGKAACIVGVFVESHLNSNSDLTLFEE